MDLKLYVIPGSHPCATVEAALALKGLEYERVDLLPGMSSVLQLARFGRRTVPGLVVDGYKVSGSRLILRTLEGLEPEPPLYPADPQRAKAVDEAERWGDADLQHVIRMIIAYALSKNPAGGDTYLAGANIPTLPAPVSAAATRAIFTVELRLLGGGAAGAEEALRGLPQMLDKIDGLIADGVIGGESPNAADLQIAGSVRLLLTFADLRDELDARPAGRLARRLIPHYPGDMAAGTLPTDWIPRLAETPEPSAAPA
jgi:glutathione S-transferase